MLYAVSAGQKRIEAYPGAGGKCPACGDSLIPRCGVVNVWHWAHRGGDCDLWWEPETAWHRDWKLLAGLEHCEVVIGPHRADIVGPKGVIELQRSPICPSEAAEREQFYGEMVWLFDGADLGERIDIRRYVGKKEVMWSESEEQWGFWEGDGWKGSSANPGAYITFRWKNPRKTHWYLAKPQFIDLGDGRLLDIRRIYDNIPCGGWGYLVDRGKWAREYLPAVGVPGGNG